MSGQVSLENRQKKPPDAVLHRESKRGQVQGPAGRAVRGRVPSPGAHSAGTSSPFLISGCCGSTQRVKGTLTEGIEGGGGFRVTKVDDRRDGREKQRSRRYAPVRPGGTGRVSVPGDPAGRAVLCSAGHHRTTRLHPPTADGDLGPPSGDQPLQSSTRRLTFSFGRVDSGARGNGICFPHPTPTTSKRPRTR